MWCSSSLMSILAIAYSLRMAVHHESGYAFFGFAIQAKHSGDAGVGDPHLGAGYFPIVVPKVTVALADLGDVAEMDAARAVLVVSGLGRIGLVVIFVKAERCRFFGVRPAVVRAIRAEFQSSCSQQVTRLLAPGRHDLKYTIRFH